MTEREFVFWLRGYLSCGSVTLSEKQVQVVKRSLLQVNDSRPLGCTIPGHEKEYEEEIDLYKTYGGD